MGQPDSNSTNTCSSTWTPVLVSRASLSNSTNRDRQLPTEGSLLGSFSSVSSVTQLVLDCRHCRDWPKRLWDELTVNESVHEQLNNYVSDNEEYFCRNTKSESIRETNKFVAVNEIVTLGVTSITMEEMFRHQAIIY